MTAAEKSNFVQQLGDNGLLWSYDKAQWTSLPDDIIIEQTLLYADVPALKFLFANFASAEIDRVWETNLLPYEKYKKINYYLATFFFKRPLKPASVYETRLDRLERIAAQNP